MNRGDEQEEGQRTAEGVNDGQLMRSEGPTPLGLKNKTTYVLPPCDVWLRPQKWADYTPSLEA